jgi:hypothetical protein
VARAAPSAVKWTCIRRLLKLGGKRLASRSVAVHLRRGRHSLHDARAVAHRGRAA